MTSGEDGRLRMRPDIFLEGPQYAGIASTRKEVFGDAKDDSGKNEKRVDAKKRARYFWESDRENNEANLQGMQDLSYESSDAEMDALDKEYKELQAQEEEVLRGLKGRSDEEVLKGKAVRHQKALWDKALEVRILLQKPFSIANSLPMEKMRNVMCENDEEVKNAYAKLTASSVETIRCFSDIIKAVMEQNSWSSEVLDLNHISEDKKTIDSSTDVLWQDISSLYSGFVPFRNSSIDRWQRKTQLSSGAAVSKNKLKAFNQSISQQIENHMRDFSRILQRMQLRSRSSIDILGMPKESDDSQRVDVPDAQATFKDADGDPELIDDIEFYQELLREFLESSDPSSIGSFNAMKGLRNKKRKVVDRRASKGRKIRYNVHEKIVNFMAPVPINMPPMAEKLLSNLFGQGVCKE